MGSIRGKLEEMSQRVQKASSLHRNISSGNVQPDQLGRPARLYHKDPAPTLGIEHHASGNLRLDGHGAVDADRRPTAHVASEVVRARRHQDLVDRAVVDGGGELSDAAHQDLVQLPAVQHEGGRTCAAELHDQTCWDAGDRHGQVDEVEEPCRVDVHLSLLVHLAPVVACYDWDVAHVDHMESSLLTRESPVERPKGGGCKALVTFRW